MLSSALGAGFFFLMGLGSIWVGWYGARVNVAVPPGFDAARAQRQSAGLAWWWRIA